MWVNEILQWCVLIYVFSVLINLSRAQTLTKSALKLIKYVLFQKKDEKNS